MGLLDAFKQYVRDAMPGGLLSAEWTPENVRTAAEVTAFEPGLLGSAASAGLAVDDLRKGNYGDAALNGLGLLPFVPAIGILKRADLKPGGPEFGKWELQRVERRTRPEEYIDATGQERLKYVADMANAEQSWGSGQPVANIYWMKDKRTGEIKPFGDDTAHQALGLQSSTAAKKQFSASLENQLNEWFASQRKSLGYEWHNAPQKFEQVREWLIKGQINEDRALELMKKYSGK